MEIREYSVKPANNGWTIRFHDHNSNTDHTIVAKTSIEVGNFFKSLDKGRAAADKQLSPKGK